MIAVGSYCNFQINKDELGYSIDEFKGELYRMKLSCSGDRPPNSGCIFFKVLGKISVAKGECDE